MYPTAGASRRRQRVGTGAGDAGVVWVWTLSVSLGYDSLTLDALDELAAGPGLRRIVDL